MPYEPGWPPVQYGEQHYGGGQQYGTQPGQYTGNWSYGPDGQPRPEMLLPAQPIHHASHSALPNSHYSSHPYNGPVTQNSTGYAPMNQVIVPGEQYNSLPIPDQRGQTGFQQTIYPQSYPSGHSQQPAFYQAPQPSPRQYAQPSPRVPTQVVSSVPVPHHSSRSSVSVPQPQHQHQQTGAFGSPIPTPQRQHYPSSNPVHSEPSASQLRVAHVEIAVPRSVESQSPDMARSAKRRRSNEGHPVSVSRQPPPQHRSTSGQTKREPAPSSSLTELASSQLPPAPPTNIDYQAALLNLSDEYISAAHAMSGPIIANSTSEEQEEQYYELMSKGMGCLESVLSNFRQSDPRKEARIRLRLASLLVEETENNEEAEAVLSKGISLCERSRLPDLKYAMHHFAARLMYRSSPKAALKAIDKLVQEVEALGAQHWAYCFRLLRVSLGMQTHVSSDTAGTLKHLSNVNAQAETGRHISIQIVASLLEAMVHLRSEHVDAIDLAQAAMARARQHQLGAEMKSLPQAQCLLHCLDLMSGFAHFNEPQVIAKLQHMHRTLDEVTRDPIWNKDGSIAVELGMTANDDIVKDTAGIMRRTSQGHVALNVQWLSKIELYAVGFMLSGHTTMNRNPVDGKSDKALVEGLKMENIVPHSSPQSLAASEAMYKRQAAISLAIRLETAFAKCSRFDWSSAQRSIKMIRDAHAQNGAVLDPSTTCTLMYLEGMCRQAEGHLESAHALYTSPQLAFDPADRKTPAAERDLRILAALNSILIERGLTNDTTAGAPALAALQPHCLAHPNQALAAAFHLLKATASAEHSPIIKTKEYIQAAVQASKASQNQQLLAICMNLMTDTFFKGIVGAQAEKSASAALQLSRQTRDGLWVAVADGMFAEIKTGCGKGDEAARARKEGRSAVSALANRLREGLAEGAD